MGLNKNQIDVLLHQMQKAIDERAKSMAKTLVEMAAATQRQIGEAEVRAAAALEKKSADLRKMRNALLFMLLCISLICWHTLFTMTADQRKTDAQVNCFPQN